MSTFQCLGRNDLTDADRTRDPIENIEGIKPSLSQEIQSPRKSEDDGPENDLYSVSLTDTLNSFRLEKRFTDFIISVDGNHFSAHKNILAASCEFFREMFNTSEENCYEIKNVEPKAVDEVLTFLYTGKCWMCEQNAASVLSVAGLLGLCDLQDALEIYLSPAESAYRREHACAEGKLFVQSRNSLLMAIRGFQIEGLFCDVSLTTNCGSIIPVHRNILAAVSGYFQGLLRSEMKEVKERYVDLTMVDGVTASELLKFLYLGKISITFDNVKSLLQASDYLLIDTLKTTIAKFLTDSLSMSNFWQLFSLVKSFSFLKEIPISRIVCSNYWDISNSDEFLEATEEDMKFFLSNDDILSSEAQILESLIRWYKFSMKQRKGSFQNLLHLIHMASIPDLYLKFLADKEAIVELYSHAGHQRKEKIPLGELTRTAHLYNLAVVGITTDPDYPDIQMFCWLPFAGPWSYLFSIHTHPINWCGGRPFIYHNDVLYLQLYRRIQLGFFKGPLTARKSTNSSLDPATLTESLSTETEDCAAVALDWCIYVIGGIFESEVLSTVQRYNSTSQSWECVASMQEQRYYHCAVNYQDRYIYVLGGAEGLGCQQRIYKSTVERYDPEKNCWSYVASMHQPRINGLACVLTHKIFVLGGETIDGNPPNCEVYDPLTDEWQMGCFQLKEATLPKLNPHTGSFRRQLFESDSLRSFPSSLSPTPYPFRRLLRRPESDGNDDGSRDSRARSPHKAFDWRFVYSPSVTCCNGLIILFDFGLYWHNGVRLPVYLVNPESGNFKILYSLSSPFDEYVSRGVITPLSRKDMMSALVRGLS